MHARCAVLAVLSLSLSGCWLLPDATSGHTRSNPGESQLTAANVATLHQAWSLDSPGWSVSEPLVSGGRVYFAAAEFAAVRVRALDAASGNVAWDQAITPEGTDEVFFHNPVAFVGGDLWASWGGLTSGACAGSVRLDPADGSIVATEDRVPTSSAVEHRGVVAETNASGDCSTILNPGILSVRDAQTLAPLWSYEDAGYGEAPALEAGRLFYQNLAFDLAGCGSTTCPPVWTAALARSISDGPAARSDTPVFYATAPSLPGATDGQLIAVDRDTGAILWRGPYNATTASIAVTRDRVYLAGRGTGSGAGRLQVFSANGCGASTCGPLWTAPAGTTPVLPTVAGGVVYVADGDAVHALPAAGCGAATCTELGNVAVDGTISGLSVDGGQLYVTATVTAGSLNRVTAFAPTT